MRSRVLFREVLLFAIIERDEAAEREREGEKARQRSGMDIKRKSMCIVYSVLMKEKR